MRALACLTISIVLVAAPASAQERSGPAPEAREPFDLASAMREGPPMTAERAAALAIEASPSVERARALGRAAEAGVSRTRAAMLPRLELTARYAHIDGFPDGQISTAPDPEALAMARTLAESISDPASRALWIGSLTQQADGAVSIRIPRDQTSFGARITWPVSDLFFAMMPAVEAAEAGGRARQRQIDASSASVARAARETFYQLARARGAQAVAQQAVLQAQAQQARIDAAVRAGFLTEADRLAAQARVSAAEHAVVSAGAGVEIADAALRAITGQDDGPIYGIAEPLLDGAESTGDGGERVEALSALALEQRPELEAVREALTAQRATAQASDAAGYPHLILFAGADLANPNRYVIPPADELQPSWDVGALLSWSPNDTLGAFHRGEELAAQYAAAEAELEQLERAVRLEVRQAHASMRSAERASVSARAALAAAEAAYESRDAQLRAGDATIADLFLADAERNRARLSVLDAAVQQRLARALLDYAVGR